MPDEGGMDDPTSKSGRDKRVPPNMWTRQAGPSIAWIGGSGSTPMGRRRAIWADGKVVKAKAFTEKRR